MSGPRGARTAETLGVLGLPSTVAELARGRWDVIVVGAGHNGLACAAYLARAGRRVSARVARARAPAGAASGWAGPEWVSALDPERAGAASERVARPAWAAPRAASAGRPR